MRMRKKIVRTMKGKIDTTAHDFLLNFLLVNAHHLKYRLPDYGIHRNFQNET